jgi:hypothetical protein
LRSTTARRVRYCPLGDRLARRRRIGRPLQRSLPPRRLNIIASSGASSRVATGALAYLPAATAGAAHAACCRRVPPRHRSSGRIGCPRLHHQPRPARCALAMWNPLADPLLHCVRRRSRDDASPARLPVPGCLVGCFPTQRGKIERLWAVHEEPPPLVAVVRGVPPVAHVNSFSRVGSVHFRQCCQKCRRVRDAQPA